MFLRKGLTSIVIIIRRADESSGIVINDFLTEANKELSRYNFYGFINHDLRLNIYKGINTTLLQLFKERKFPSISYFCEVDNQN